MAKVGDTWQELICVWNCSYDCGMIHLEVIALFKTKALIQLFTVHQFSIENLR